MAPDRGLPASSDLLTTSEVAALLRVSVTTLRRYVGHGWIEPAAVIGRSYLFTREAVERLRVTLGRP